MNGQKFCQENRKKGVQKSKKGIRAPRNKVRFCYILIVLLELDANELAEDDADECVIL